MSIQSQVLGKVSSLVGDAWLVNQSGTVALQQGMTINANDLIVTAENSQGTLAFENGANFQLLPHLKQLFQAEGDETPPESVIQSLDLSEILAPAQAGEGNNSSGGSFFLTRVNFNAGGGAVTAGFETSTLSDDGSQQIPVEGQQFIPNDPIEVNDNIEGQQFIPNDPIEVSGGVEGQTIEDGKLIASGTLIATGGDSPQFNPANYFSTYGEFTVNSDGSWEYKLDNENAQELRGSDSVSETFDVLTTGADGEVVVTQVQINIQGQEDAPVIDVKVEGGHVQEDVTYSTGGQLIASDVDRGDTPTFVENEIASQYGKFIIHTDGSWTYDLDNNAAQGLAGGDNVVELFQVEARTDDGESAFHTIEVIVKGSEDAPQIFGESKGVVSEDSQLTAEGQLNTFDRDTVDNPVFVGDTIAGKYGTFTINSDGEWSYQLDNDAANAMAKGDVFEEKFDVVANTADGESANSTVTINVNGANDAPDAVDDTASFNFDDSNSINGNVITPNDSDPDGDSLSITNAGEIAGKYGTLTLEENGDYSYEMNDFDLSDGLVSYWTFDNANGNKVSDLANEGVKADTIKLKNGASVAGGSLSLDGSNDIAEIANSNDINLGKHDARSISFNFQADEPGGERQVLYEEGAQVRGLTVYLQAGQLHVLGWNTPQGESDWDGTHFSFELNDTDWHNITLTLDGNSGEFSAYLDGVGQTGDGSALWQHSGDINFGATGGRTFYYDTDTNSIAVDNQNSKHAFFDGQIDDARIYDRALNETEVNILANQGEELTESFDYQISDGELTDDATLTINLSDNEAPQVEDQITDEDTGLTIDIESANVYDVSADNGSVTVNANGDLEYTPDEHYSGSDEISYKVADELGNIETRTINVSVTPVADNPIINTSGLIPTGENLLINGSFEADVGLNGRKWGVFDTEVTGWDLESGSGIEIQRNTITTASDGSQYVELDSRNNSTMSQTLNTDPNHSYEIQFDYMPRPGVSEASNVIKVLWNGEVIDELSGQGGTWTSHVYTVEGGQEDGVLSFEAAGISDSLGGFLDNMTVTDLNSFSVDIEAMLVDTDGSEDFASITMDGLPVGAILSDGVNEFEGNGVDSANLLEDGWDLSNLQLELPNDAEYSVSVSATSEEGANGSTAQTSQVIATNDGVTPQLTGADNGSTVFHFSDNTIGNDNVSEYHISNFNSEGSSHDVIELSNVLNGFDINSDDINDYLSVDTIEDENGNVTGSEINISTEGNGTINESIVLKNVDLSNQGALNDSSEMLNNMLSTQTLVVE